MREKTEPDGGRPRETTQPERGMRGWGRMGDWGLERGGVGVGGSGERRTRWRQT